ncbi:uncharacterized protein LOC132178224 [Corylus avellana]|uniref:uncharacterized protein LOC132178224 n=1 Tax=Corylus avellana TaxID=13451 RepID=UPI00286D5340|nr:uncharacterized protein LOC132178224 [Corylus avellana]
MPPPEGMIKLNWDASLSKEENRMGIGVVARDHVGSVRASLCASRPYMVDPAAAEAMALWYATVVIHPLCLQKVILEGDALEVVNNMKRDGLWNVSYGLVLEDAKNNICFGVDWQVMHVSCTANGVAHKLAKLAVAINDEQTLGWGLPPLYPRQCNG